MSIDNPNHSSSLTYSSSTSSSSPTPSPPCAPHYAHSPSQLVSSKSDGALLKDELLLSSNTDSRNISPPELHFGNRVNVADDTDNNSTSEEQQHYSPYSSSSSSPGDNHLQPRNRSASYSNLPESLSSLYLPQISRQLGTTIMSGLSWINQIEFGSILQSLVNNTNIFRRRNSSTLHPQITKNSATNNANHNAATISPTNSAGMGYSSNTFQTKALARLLNGSAIKTLKSSELIELSSFGLVELDNVEPGIGHEFQRYENDKPTWCDACAEFLSSPVMNDNESGGSKSVGADNTTPGAGISSSTTTANAMSGKSSSLSATTPVAVQADHLMRTYLQCRKCNYVCHLKCHHLIRIDCQPSLARASASHSPPQNYLRSSSAKPKRNRRHRESVRFDGALADSLNTLTATSSPTTETITELPTALDSNNNTDEDMTTDGNSHESSATSSADTSQNESISSSSFTSSQDVLDTDQTEEEGAEEEEAANSASDSVFEHQQQASNGTCDHDEETDEAQKADQLELDKPLVNGETNCTPKTDQSTCDSKAAPFTSSGPQPLLELLTPTVIVDLRQKILRYNERTRGKGSGLGITLIDEHKQLFRGFLRVHMNLTRPINVVAGKRPPSIYDIINEEENLQPAQRRTLTSFYMPRDTVKNIHITSEGTSLQVIKAMLKKFKVVDNPQKFALYLRRRFPEEELQRMKDEHSGGSNRLTSTTTTDEHNRRFEQAISQFLTPSSYEHAVHSLKRLNDQERPLILQLEFDSFLFGSVDIVLQENDNADIAWDAFEVPELKNFLKILDREENEHLEHVRSHYDEMKHVMRALIEYEEAKARHVDIKHPKAKLPPPEDNDPGGGSGATSAGSLNQQSGSVVAVES